MLSRFRIIGCIFLLACALQPLHAQWTINGRVLDRETKEPLPGALAIIAGETRGAICDSTGRFTLRTSLITPVLNVQYLGYKSLSKRLDLKQQQDYEFAMEPDPMTLPTTTITAEGLQRVHPDPTTHVIDYEFLDGNLLLIVYDRLRKRNVLQLFSQDLRLLAEADAPDYPLNALMPDCMGARHCFSEDFVAQVDYAKGNLFLRWDSMAVFNRVVAPCLASLDSTYYFAFMPHNYAKAFTYLHAGATRRKYLYGTIDNQALEIIRDEGMAVVRTNSNADVPITSSFATPELMRAMFQAELNARYLSTVVCPPLYVPIKAVRSSIYIFDHPHDLLLRFDELGECRDTLHITYNALRDWRKEIIVDEEGQEAYTLTEKDGFVRLHRIDLNVGNLAESWELPYPYPIKIKVMGGSIYFTYRDNAGDATKRLYRMQM